MVRNSSNLALFELDRPDDSWLKHIRQAEADLPLGRLGAYELLEEAARGGQGVVYRARQPGTHREIAVKRLLGGVFASPATRRRFEREVEAAAALNHPNIVTVHGSEFVDGQPLMTMEWIEGVPATDWSKRGDHFQNLRQLLQMCARICEAISHAHQRGVIHRDLKPSNILVDGNDQPHVLDFGLAKPSAVAEALDPALTSTAQFVGTLAFAAPEQLRGRSDDVDVRTDVYALGVIFYQMLTGKPPYDTSDTLADAIQSIATSEPRRPRSIRSELDGEVEAILLKALEKDKERRYQSAGALADDLNRYLAGETVLAHPPSAAYQLRKLIRRHKVPFVLLGTILLLILSFAGVATGLWRSAVDARESEREARQAAEQINIFLQDMLGSANPYEQERDVTVREVLDRTALSLDEQFAEHPAVEAAVRHTLGSSYLSLGLFDEAEPHLRRALELRESESEGDDPDLASTINSLGQLLRYTSRYDQAEPLIVEALEMRRRLWGDEHEDVAQSLNNRAMMFRDKGDLEAAAPLAREALRIQRKLLGEDHPETLKSVNLLAKILFSLRDYETAEQLLSDALEAGRGTLGADHPTVVAAVGNLAAIYYLQKNYEAAIPLLREDLEANRRIWGPDHGRTATSMNNLGMILIKTGRYEDAEPLLTEALQLTRNFFGEELTVAARLQNLGDLLIRMQRYPDAEVYLTESLAIRRKLLERNHPLILRSLQSLSDLMMETERYLDAETYLREIWQLHRAQLGDDHEKTAVSQSKLGACLTAEALYEHAEPLLFDSHKILNELLGAEDRHTIQALDRLIQLYEDWGKPQQAEAYWAIRGQAGSR